jgi:hypothetical protein
MVFENPADDICRLIVFFRRHAEGYRNIGPKAGLRPGMEVFNTPAGRFGAGDDALNPGSRSNADGSTSEFNDIAAPVLRDPKNASPA